MTINEIIKKYNEKIDLVDLEILISHSSKKTREFLLAHPEYELSKIQILNLTSNIKRRVKGEPIAYIIGKKEFYGLDFEVNKHTLIPRPETELMVELALNELKVHKVSIVDVGTGSGNIIISIAKSAPCSISPDTCHFYAIDISKEALKVAKKNAKKHSVDKKIKFLHGNLLSPLVRDWKLKNGNSKMIILANLPYLSKEIYNSAPIDVKKFEPKSALYSANSGLAHYKKLLKQIHQLLVTDYKLPVTIFFEISPEQKIPATKLIKSILPDEKIEFFKDLAGKWRLCKIKL